MKAIVLAALALAAPAAAQAPKPQPITIAMTDHGFVPRRIALTRNAPYVLHLVNRTGIGHNLEQKVFFRLARVLPADRRWVRDGRIVVDSNSAVTVGFTAPNSRPGGTFQFSSTTLGDAANDYKGVFLIR